MSTPTTIHLSQIVFNHPTFGDRARSKYNGIEELAECLEEVGLIEPVILSPLPEEHDLVEPGDVGVRIPCFLLEAGGRRTRALELLFTDGPIAQAAAPWDGIFEHAATCRPGRPGFLLKGEPATKESLWMTELTENLHREGLHWTDEMKLIVKAYREFKRKADLEHRPFYYHTLGQLLGGYGYADIQAAVVVHDRVLADPEAYATCSNFRDAYKRSLKLAQDAVIAEQARRLRAAQPVQVLVEPKPGEEGQPVEPPPVVVPFSNHFRNCDSLEWMADMAGGSGVDHIICDPDFAVSEERLESNSVSAGDGIAQESVEESLEVLQTFIYLSSRCLRDHGFLIFWYDLDHHNLLQNWCTLAGFRVQRWPVTWLKPDFRSNANPGANFTKNIEYAMVCSKPGSRLATPGVVAGFTLPNGTVAKDYNHPFAKPPSVWARLYSAVATPGQTVYDPFLGSGSSVDAALDLGLIPYGSELSPSHFNNATMNIHRAYERTLKRKVRFE